MPEEIDNHTLDELMRALDASDASALLAAAEEAHYADLAAVYENLDDEKRDLLLKTIGPEMATDVIAELPYPLIEEALNHFKPAQLRVLLGNLSDDDRVDVFQVVSEEAQVRFFSLLGPRDKELTRSLLKYEEDTAGGRMTTSIGRITADMTVKQAITVLRRDRDGLPVLLDFGPGGVTPGYAPPERGRGAEPAAWMDLYSLAVVALVLLSGEEPAQLLDPTTLQWRWPTALDALPDLRQALERMLSEAAEQRFPSASAALQVLQQLCLLLLN